MTPTRRHISAATALLAAALTLNTALPAQTIESAANAGDTTNVVIAGGNVFFTDGNVGRFQQDMGVRDGVSGGIEYLSITKAIDATSHLDLTGHLIAGQNDYLFAVAFTKDDIFKVDLGYKQFRTWYDGSAGYFPRTGNFYSTADNSLHTDRGSFWIGVSTLLSGSKPNFSLRYQRDTRQGTKGSTIFGSAAQGTPYGTRFIAPAFYDLDETIDTITLNIDQQFESVAWGVGGTYQRQKVDNDRFAAMLVANTNINTKDQTSSDIFVTHAYVTGDIGRKLSYGAGGLFSNLNSDLNGSQITYSGTDPVYDPTNRRPYTGSKYQNLSGGSNYKQYVGNANIAWRPTPNWAIVPALRLESYRTDTVANFDVFPGTVPNSGPINMTANRSNNETTWFETSQAIEARYTGFRNWTHTVSSELLQGSGELNEELFNPNTRATPNTYRYTDQKRYTQKHSYSVNWYAKSGLTFAGQYYYKYNRNYNDTPANKTSSNSGFIRFQGFETHDFNLRATWRPAAQLGFITRYDYQRSTIDTQVKFPATPNRTESSRNQTHIISETISYAPITRLYFMANASLTYDQVTSPIVANSAGVLKNSDNNYFNTGLSATYAASDIDDLVLDYTFYRANNFIDNSAIGLPYGANERQHVAALAWTRRLTTFLNFTVRYTFADYTNKATGGNTDYRSNGIYGRVQYRF